MKLCKPCVRLIVLKNFSQCVINVWNKQLEHVTDAPSFILHSKTGGTIIGKMWACTMMCHSPSYYKYK